MKKTVVYLFFCSFILSAGAQNEELQKQFNAFRKEVQQSYQNFVDEKNREYIEFLQEAWKKFKMEKPIERPVRPEPPQPIAYEKPTLPKVPLQIDVDDVVILPVPVQQPVPENAPEPATPPQQPAEWVVVDYYGSKIYVDNKLEGMLHLNGISEKEVAKGWETLCKTNYQRVLSDCKNIREYYVMNDWGYALFMSKVAEALCGGENNEKVLMHVFLLSQSEYKVRMVRNNNRLALIAAIDCMLYGVPFLTLNGEKYFNILSKQMDGEIYTYEKNFGGAKRNVSMRLTSSPVVRDLPEDRIHQAKGYPITVHSKVNRGLINFYRDYPQCDFHVYACAAMSDEFRETVLPALAEAVAGKTETEAADMLLNFVQTAFEYQKDDEQFGYEKPFFIDETFYYPYSDCEDRAVLYQTLVKNLLKLDVVLLDYPNHLATAVRFHNPVDGDFVMVGTKKYIVCDPTYINASIGCAMPQFKSTKAVVVK